MTKTSPAAPKAASTPQIVLLPRNASESAVRKNRYVHMINCDGRPGFQPIRWQNRGRLLDGRVDWIIEVLCCLSYELTQDGAPSGDLLPPSFATTHPRASLELQQVVIALD